MGSGGCEIRDRVDYLFTGNFGVVLPPGGVGAYRQGDEIDQFGTGRALFGSGEQAAQRRRDGIFYAPVQLSQLRVGRGVARHELPGVRMLEEELQERVDARPQ